MVLMKMRAKFFSFWLVFFGISCVTTVAFSEGIDLSPSWQIVRQSTGIKAWRFGVSSDKNYQYVDPLSPIVSASTVSDTGWVTYLVAGSKSNDFIVKRVDFVKGGEPEIIGTLEGARGEWRFSSPGGPTFAAYEYVLTSKGILLLRDTTVFTYLPSKKPTAQILPEGWSMAWVQKGDIESSRLIVVRKLDAINPLGGSNFQIGFYDIDQGKIIETISMKMLDFDAAKIFPNKFYLFNTAKGPLCIAIENGHKQVVVRNIRSGEKRVIFERDLGVASLKAEQGGDGRISVRAGVGFSNPSIDDAEAFLYADAKSTVK
jgi:hypothetical protein